MKTLHQINCKIFDIVKDKELILYSELPKMVNVNQDLVLQSIGKLKNDYGLIGVISQKLSLSEKGLKHKSFESYLKSLKKDPISTHRKRQLILTILSILTAIIFGILNYLSNKRADSLASEKSVLTDDYNLLKSDFVRYKDSVIKQNIKTVKTTLRNEPDISQTKNPNDLKTD